MSQSIETECNRFVNFSTKKRGVGTCGLCARFERGCVLPLAMERRNAMNRRRINTDSLIGETGRRFSNTHRYH